ncbi:ubiquitin-related domain-containing protein [Flammula alnicola]|nr:ubiquitin-related domain-containing protein [Flammula alnicola]
MSSNDAQVIAMDNREDTSPSHMQLLAAPFAVTPGQQDIVPPSSRSSFTRVDLDDEQRLHRSASHDPITPSMTLPTLLHTANIVAVDQTLISTLSQEQQQLKIQTETPTPAEPAMEGTVPQMPQIYLNFLLISGKRRTMSFEPDTTVGRVKELVWNSWPADWQDDRPPAPSYLRVLYLGRMLQDDETLNREFFALLAFYFGFALQPSPYLSPVSAFEELILSQLSRHYFVL